MSVDLMHAYIESVRGEAKVFFKDGELEAAMQALGRLEDMVNGYDRFKQKLVDLEMIEDK